MSRGLLFLAALAAVALLPGCGGGNGGQPMTLAQAQQAELNAFDASLTAADNTAKACIQAGLPICVQNKAKIQQAAAKLFADTTAAQSVITAGGDATSNLQTISQEIAALVALLPPQTAQA